MNRLKSNTLDYIYLPVVLCFGAFLRFYNNTALALWHDEAFSALYLRYNWGEMMYRVGLDVHPPLYYLLLRIWHYILGDSLLSLRSFSILFGVLTIWAGYKFAARAFKSSKIGLLAALFLAINPFQIQYALEARMYTLGTFLALFSSYLLVVALDKKKHWIFYGIAAAAAIYTHYYLVFTIAAQGLFIIAHAIKHRKLNTLWRALGAYILAFILYLPWLKILLRQIAQVQENYWIPAMNAWSVPGTIWKMAFGGAGIRNVILAIATAATAWVIVYFVRRVKNFQKWHILLGLIVPFICAIILSSKTNLYLDRYFVFASLYFSLLLAVVLMHFKRFRKTLIVFLAIATVFAFFKNWSDLNIQNKPGMAEAARYINSKANENDKIYIGSSFVYFTFKYYNKTGIAPLLYSPGSLESIPHFSGTALLTNDDLIGDFNLAPLGSTVFLLWTTGFGGSKPDVPDHWKPLEEKIYEDAPGFKGQIIVNLFEAQ